MLKIAFATMLLTSGLVAAAQAGLAPPPAIPLDGPVLKVGEGCGANHWRGPRGGCNPFNGPEGNNRGTTIECPPGFHISYNRDRCMPNG